MSSRGFGAAGSARAGTAAPKPSGAHAAERMRSQRCVLSVGARSDVRGPVTVIGVIGCGAEATGAAQEQPQAEAQLQPVSKGESCSCRREGGRVGGEKKPVRIEGPGGRHGGVHEGVFRAKWVREVPEGAEGCRARALCRLELEVLRRTADSRSTRSAPARDRHRAECSSAALSLQWERRCGTTGSPERFLGTANGTARILG